MAYIRNRHEERTGYQDGSPYSEKTDIQSDFVMVYRYDETMLERIRAHQERGHVTHFMTGISWGRYQDYVYGEWDGKDHTDEIQTDRFGNNIMHNPRVPYMVPTVLFADYLTESLKAVVDAGVEAIHVEEPEFWDRAGYSEAFKREYLLYYREPWQPPHSSVDARYKASRLKAYLFRRTIDRVSSALKEYALTTYGRTLRFYVPTHSLLNYTQWKIMSPEGSLAEVPAVDGFIAQVWTGTAREENAFEGVIKERTLETAYLEYGIMQELTKGTGKKMWFLHDPIEDNPIFTWENYRYNYLKTVSASLLHSKINSYEICPWPHRIFNGLYPKDSPDATTIPPEYATLLCGMFQTLGDMEISETVNDLRVGVLLSDSALFQRDYPDNILSDSIKVDSESTVVRAVDDLRKDFTEKLFKGTDPDGRLMNNFVKSNALPSFYGLCLPLLKYGMPIRPVSLDNVRRYSGYLDDYDVLLVSYEFIKPEYPDVNNALASWVKNGGQLIYVGDGSDPYHKIKAWWNSGTVKYPTPAEHLFEAIGIEAESGTVQEVGNGHAAILRINPATICFSHENAEQFRQFFKNVIAKKGRGWSYSNRISEKRGPYIVTAVFDESVTDEPTVCEGLFADMYTETIDVVERKVINPDDSALLFDFSQIENESLRVIGCSARVDDLTAENGQVELNAVGAADIKAYIRLRTPFPVSTATADDGTDVTAEYDEKSRTVLLSFDSTAKPLHIVIK